MKIIKVSDFSAALLQKLLENIIIFFPQFLENSMHEANFLFYRLFFKKKLLIHFILNTHTFLCKMKIKMQKNFLSYLNVHNSITQRLHFSCALETKDKWRFEGLIDEALTRHNVLKSEATEKENFDCNILKHKRFHFEFLRNQTNF